MRLLDSMRSILGVRKRRAVPAAGPKPRLGARIVKDDVRITVQAGLTDATWRWLVLHGWRSPRRSPGRPWVFRAADRTSAAALQRAI